MDGEEARGGERDSRAGKVVVDMELGRGDLGGGGGEGGPQPSLEHSTLILIRDRA